MRAPYNSNRGSQVEHFASRTYPRVLSLVMSDTRLAETPAWVPDNIDKSDISSPLEVQTSMVDSMSPPHTTESTSARHALARDYAALQLIDDDIEECRMRIARAQAQMLLLERQRNVVQSRVSIHRARLSPLRTVPDQVLQEIFQHCLPDTPYVVPNACSAPLLLTHVCRRWRVVAQGSSELWSSIALYDRGAWNYELEVEMVKRWLDRSHTRPVHMSIACPPRTSFGSGPPCSDLFQVVIAHSSRLSVLRLDVNRTYLNHFMNRANLFALRSLVILFHSERLDEPPAPGPVIPVSLAAPHLRHVALKGDRTPISLFPRTLCPQMTHLSLDCDTPDLSRLFRDFSCLERLTLTPRLRSSSPPRSAHRAVGLSLRRLDVRLDADMLEFGDPATALASVLDTLELPALRALVIAVPVAIAAASRRGAEKKNHVGYEEWVCSPSVRALSSRSRCCAQPQLERWDPLCP